MADNMEEVTQRFRADVGDYVAEVQSAADKAQEFALANEETKKTLDSVRDKALEAAAALKITRDAQGKLRDSAGEVLTASEAEALALKHIRDQALEAAWAMRELDKYQKKGTFERLAGGISSGLNSFFTGNGGGMGSGMMSLPGILAIVVAVETLLPEVVGLVSGFAAAAAGAGAFYLLAHPAITNLQSDVQSLSSANQALGIAQQKYLIDPTKAHAKSLQEAQLTYQAIYKQMGSDAGPAAAGMLKLHDTYVKLSNAFQPEAFKVIGGFLNLANQLLPAIVPFATTFADAFSGLLGKASQFAGSGGFKDWLEQFHKLEGPSITAIGNGIGKVAIAIGKLLTSMSAKDVVNAINIAFTILAGTVNVVTFMLKRLMDNWDGVSVAARHSWYDIKRWTDDVTQAFDKVRHFAATMAHDFASDFDAIRHDVAQWADDVRHDADAVVRWFEQLPGRILHAVESFGHLLEHAGMSLIDGLIHGIESKVDELRARVEGLGNDVVGWAKDVLGIFSPSRKFAELGQMISQGLAVGIGETMSYATGMARALGEQVAIALNAGEITSSEAASLTARITAKLASDTVKVAQAATKLALDFNNALTRSLEDASSASAAKSAVAKLAGYVKQAWTSGLIDTGQETAITSWLDGQSTKLQALAGQRAQIVKEIAQARQYAASTASNIAGNYALSGFATSGMNGGAATVGQIVTGLRIDVGQIRKWAHNIHKLAKEGLNRSYLGQLIALGPIQGAAIAQELANANLGDIKAINSAEYQISEASGQMGKLAANAMYDSGAAAGKGFLSGLEAQRKAITQLMESIVKAMLATLKKELGISSPSTVTRWHAQMAGEGIVQGLLDSIGRVRQAASMVAAAAVPGGSRGGLGTATGGYAGGASVHVSIPVNVTGGAGAPYQSPEFMQYMQRIVQEAVLRFGEMNPNNGLTSMWGR